MSDGIERKNNIKHGINESSFTIFTIDGQQYDNANIWVERPDEEGKLLIYIDAIYVRCDLEIGGLITMLSLDCNKASGAVSSGLMNVYGNNPCLLSFNYKLESRKNNEIQMLSAEVNKNISIYMEKKFFGQENFGANSFAIIVQQQFYDVEPDPRNCDALITDKNIYSSK